MSTPTTQTGNAGNGSVATLRPTTVAEAVSAFQANLKYRRRAEGTLKQYNPVLRDFVEWAGERAPGEISSRELEGGFLAWWIADFEERRDRYPSSHAIKNVIVALRSLYKYLSRYGMLVDGEGHIVANPAEALETPTIPQKPNDWLKPDEDERLLTTSMSDNEAGIVYFLRWTGLRLDEALSLRVSDVDFVDGTIYVRKSKTPRGIRGVPIAPELRPHLTSWLHVLRERDLLADHHGSLFPTKHRTPWSAQQAGETVRRVAKRAGLRIDEKGVARVSPHTLRRTFGSYLLNRGVRLEVVSKLLGHSSTTITERAYAELLTETVRKEMMEALSG